MRFVTVRDFRTAPGKIWKELPDEQEMVITNNGKPVALLTPLSDTDLEETLAAVRRARAMNAVRKMQQASIAERKDRLTAADIESEIDTVRSSQ